MIRVHARMLDGALYRQLKADQRARGVARRLSATIQRHFDELYTLIPETPLSLTAPRQIRNLLVLLQRAVVHQADQDLRKLALWSHATAARLLTHRVKGMERKQERRDDKGKPPPGSVGFRADGGFELFRPQLVQPPPGPPGGVATGAGDFERFDYSELLIEPPSAFEIAQLVGPAPLKLTKLFSPDRAAAQVWQGIAGGKDRRAIAQDLAKVLNQDMNAARRVARTEGLRVATAMQLSASEQIPELISGYQILATLDNDTRPEHHARHGAIYHRHPEGSQLGFDKMPHPPVEADGKIAFCCRCMLAPVFQDEPEPNVSFLLNTPYAADATANATASLAI
jgi:SPP1 gp7 family putative phage head morphogenesis protein